MGQNGNILFCYTANWKSGCQVMAFGQNWNKILALPQEKGIWRDSVCDILDKRQEEPSKVSITSKAHGCFAIYSSAGQQWILKLIFVLGEKGTSSLMQSRKACKPVLQAEEIFWVFWDVWLSHTLLATKCVFFSTECILGSFLIKLIFLKFQFWALPYW